MNDDVPIDDEGLFFRGSPEDAERDRLQALFAKAARDREARPIVMARIDTLRADGLDDQSILKILQDEIAAGTLPDLPELRPDATGSALWHRQALFARRATIEPPPEAVSVEEAKARLRKEVDRFFARVVAGEKGLQQGIIATAGLGKSRAVLAKLRELMEEDARVQFGDRQLLPDAIWIAVPRLELADELAKELPGARVIRGRTHGLGLDDGTPPCARAALVADAMRAGVRGISKTFCETTTDKGEVIRCPHRVGCPYWDQFRPRAQVYIVAHEYLTLTMSDNQLPRPGLVIIDESPLGSLIAANSRPFPAKAVLDRVGQHQALLELILEAFAAGKDPRTELRALRPAYDDDKATDDGDGKPWTASGLRRIASALEGPPPDIVPGLSDETVRTELKGVRRNKAADLLRRIAAEFSTGRPLRGVRYRADAKLKLEEGGRIETPAFWLQHRRALHIAKDVPVLVLDGTADPGLLKAVWPDIEVTEIEAVRHMRLVQVIGQSMSKAAFAGPRRPDLLQQLGDFIAGLSEGGLLVGQKDWVYDVALPPGWSAEHLGNLRGLDSHKARNVIVVVGRALMKASDAERAACALFYDRDVPLDLGHPDYVRTEITLRGSNRKVTDFRHVDPRVDKIRAAAAEREIEQAIDRLRLVHADEDRPVYVIGNCPTRLTVSEVIEYRNSISSRLMRAFRRSPTGVLVLRPDDLAARFPDLWETRKAAERSVGDFIPLGDDVRLWEYRLAGQRGPRPSRALARADLGQEALVAELQKVCGRPVAYAAPSNRR